MKQRAGPARLKGSGVMGAVGWGGRAWGEQTHPVGVTGGSCPTGPAALPPTAPVPLRIRPFNCSRTRAPKAAGEALPQQGGRD